MDLDDLVYISTTREKETKKMALELANDTGRKILEEIYTVEMITASEIAENLDIPLSTVLFHVERLTELNLIKIAETKLSKKFREIKCYAPAKRAILIIPAQKEKAISQIKSAIETRVLAPLSLLGAMGITVAVGWLTQRGEEIAQAAPLLAEEKADTIRTYAPEAARISTESNTFQYFLLGTVVFCVSFICIYIGARIIQRKLSLSQ
jgi:predicted ArsR family transcriptional regulator